jgi:uncharacterized protein (DUF885 family)
MLAQSAKDFAAFRDNFIKGYKALQIPALELSYADNLQHIQSVYKIQQQLDFFSDADKKIEVYETLWITDEERFDLDLMKFETALNLQRLMLEKRWTEEKPTIIPNNNLFSIPHGNEWYVYFLNRWLGTMVNPDELYFNGIEEIERVKTKLEDIGKAKGLLPAQLYSHLADSSFYFNNETALLQSFENIKNIVQQNLPLLFHARQVKNVSISHGTDDTYALSPGYYNANTFYYNYFGKPYNKRQAGWLYMHEAVPGHHYQSSIAAQSLQSPVQQLFYPPGASCQGFTEGWAAYAETLGTALGVYQTAYDELGSLEWDLIRSVRVVIDIGINYYGWNDEKALATWREYIPYQDEIAMQEINRMRKWPARVVTYKYGSSLILKWKKELQEKEGNAFDIKDFHDRLLNYGPLPLSIVRKNVFRWNNNLLTGK